MVLSAVFLLLPLGGRADDETVQVFDNPVDTSYVS